MRLATLSFAALSTILISFAAQATETDQCYRFRQPGSPTSTEEFPEMTVETWCYRLLPATRETYFVYNADAGKVRPELAFVANEDGAMLHASLIGGQLKFFRAMTNGFNPFPIPIRPPTETSLDVTPAVKPPGLEDSAIEVLKLLFQNARKKTVSLRSLGDEPSASAAKASIQPWRGFWWPYKSARLSTGTLSPLAKLDRYQRARGEVSNAQEWERVNHAFQGIGWQGHCNGWAAGTILRAEPRSSIRDSVSGVVFSISDLKGLIAEKESCVKFSFFGRRYNRPKNDLRDIDPVLFHSTIKYYLGQLKRPILMDIAQGRSIENRVVSAYTMNVIQSAPRTYTVTTTLKVHTYDNAFGSSTGPAPFKYYVYKYKVKEDTDGQIISGSWLSQNPDFLWVPLAEDDCSPTNPYVTTEVLNSILK